MKPTGSIIKMMSVTLIFLIRFFFSEGQVDGNIPLRDDCIYCIHNPQNQKYKTLSFNNYFTFQVYNRTIHEVPNLIKVEPCIYYDLSGRCVYMPWATDLLPEEINANKAKLAHSQMNNYCIWVGTIGGGRFGNINELSSFFQACNENDIQLLHKQRLSVKDNIELTMNSYFAPAIVGTWQLEVDYIPCRIFKNISYGKMGITNSKIVYDLFEHKIVYNPDTYQLFYDAKKRLETITLEELYEQMDFVKTKHTYINRIQTLLNFHKLLELKSNY